MVEIDMARCIGCQNCSQDCPWETITMYEHDDSFTAWENETLKSALYMEEDKIKQLAHDYEIGIEEKKRLDGLFLLRE